ncbi:MAG: COX15/CtaA family protein [Oligoflexia bacterium]
MSKLAKFSVGTLVFVVGVILWGALVRATGSGAGCGAHWPLCNGEMLPVISRNQTLIEFIHRASSGLSLLMVCAVGWVARRRFKDHARIRRLALLSVVGILIEAAIGAALVLLRLVEHDQSLDRAISIALHLANTCFLLGALTLLCREVVRVEGAVGLAGAAGAGGKAREFGAPALVQGNWVLGGFVVLAAAGAWTALGDTLFAPASFGEGWARDWARDAHFLERLRVVHPFLALGWVALTLPWLQGLRRAGLGGVPAVWALGLMVANVGVGGLNVLLAAPLALQILHLAVANGLWISLVLCWSSARSG